MKGSVFVLLACFALFFAAPSHSRSTSEDDQLANRRDTQSGSPSTDAATYRDAVIENTSTSAGKSKTIEMDGDANPGEESVARDTQAAKSKIRKRDTRSLVRDEAIFDPMPWEFEGGTSPPLGQLKPNLISNQAIFDPMPWEFEVGTPSPLEQLKPSVIGDEAVFDPVPWEYDVGEPWPLEQLKPSVIGDEAVFDPVPWEYDVGEPWPLEQLKPSVIGDEAVFDPVSWEFGEKPSPMLQIKPEPSLVINETYDDPMPWEYEEGELSPPEQLKPSLVRDQTIMYPMPRDYEREEPSPLVHEFKTYPVYKSMALTLLKRLGKIGGQCFEEVFNHIETHELPNFSGNLWSPEAIFTRSDLIKWLKIIKDSVSKCLMTSIGQLNSEYQRRDERTPYPPKWELFSNSSELFSSLTDIGKTLEKCLEDAITYLEATSHRPGDTVQRSSESLLDLLTELMKIQSTIDGWAVPAGDTVPWPPPGHTVPPHPGSGPVMTTYKKRNSPVKPTGYRYRYDNSPGFKQRQFSGFRGEAVQAPHTPAVTENMNAFPTQQMTLLKIVLDKIYSKLEGKVSPAINMDAAPVEGLRVDGNGALGFYPGNGKSPAMGNLGRNTDCVH